MRPSCGIIPCPLVIWKNLPLIRRELEIRVCFKRTYRLFHQFLVQNKQQRSQYYYTYAIDGLSLELKATSSTTASMELGTTSQIYTTATTSFLLYLISFKFIKT